VLTAPTTGGTIAAPGLALGATNNGVYSPGVGNVSITTGGVETVNFFRGSSASILNVPDEFQFSNAGNPYIAAANITTDRRGLRFKDGSTTNRGWLWATADGKFRASTDAGTAGVTLDVTADNILDLENRTGAANAAIKAAFVHADCVIPDGDTSPSVLGCATLTTSANTSPTAITTFDDEIVGQVFTLCGGSATNSSTLADSGQFNLSGAFTAAVDDCVELKVQALNDFIELSRVNN
jgi:hypothetical protein